MTTTTQVTPPDKPHAGNAKRMKTAVWVGATLLATGVALLSYRYLAKAGPVPPNIASNRHLNPWIIIHAGAAATALLVGPLQFMPGIRRNFPMAHRWTGRIYVVCCMFGGASALPLAIGISSGPIAGIGFAALGLFWMGTTAQGWITAKQRQFSKHRRWMIRSFALTFAAVTLRLYLPLAIGLGFDFVTCYRLIAWLCWVPNVVVAEWYLARNLGERKPTSPN